MNGGGQNKQLKKFLRLKNSPSPHNFSDGPFPYVFDILQLRFYILFVAVSFLNTTKICK